MAKQSRTLIHLKIGEGENEEMIFISSPIKNQALLGWGDAFKAIVEKREVSSVPGDYQVDGKSLGCYLRLEGDSKLRLIKEILDDFSSMYGEGKFSEIADRFTTLVTLKL